MGIICSSKLLVCPSHVYSYSWALTSFITSIQALVPALIQNIKEAGLVVVAHASDDSAFRQAGVDGILRKEGVLKFEETIGS